jgi:hypothetical protein
VRSGSRLPLIEPGVDRTLAGRLSVIRSTPFVTEFAPPFFAEAERTLALYHRGDSALKG